MTMTSTGVAVAVATALVVTGCTTGVSSDSVEGGTAPATGIENAASNQPVPLTGITVVNHSSLLSGGGSVHLQIDDVGEVSQNFQGINFWENKSDGPQPSFLFYNPPTEKPVKIWVEYNGNKYYYDPDTPQSGTNETCHDLIGDSIPLESGKVTTMNVDYEVFGWAGEMLLPDGRTCGYSFKTGFQQGNPEAVVEGVLKIVFEAAVYAASAEFGARLPGAGLAPESIVASVTDDVVAPQMFNEYDEFWRQLQQQQMDADQMLDALWAHIQEGDNVLTPDNILKFPAS